jgi:sulfite oxidase
MLSRRRFLESSAALAAAGLLLPRFPAFAQPGSALPAGKDLIVREAMPFNAEPELAQLVESFVTPVKHFYVRNHGPTPKVDPREFKVRIEGLVHKPVELSLLEIKERFRQHATEATLTCAGNRRDEMSAIKPIAGVQWNAGAIGHARWGGAALADVLKAAELKDGAKHVWFDGLDPIPEKDGTVAPFGGSIPLERALATDGLALVAHAMNDEPLTPEHGAPLRTIVPGYIGARSVKWLAKITVSDRPSPNHYVAEAYKIIQTSDPRELAAAEPVYGFAINAAICLPPGGAKLKTGRNKIAGYALPSGQPGSTTSKVELSTDGGQTWTTAQLEGDARPFAWRLWSADVLLPSGRRQLVVRATDNKGHTMRDERPWNLKGYLFNAWHRVDVEVA